jgi:Uncharacterized protein conserved in bacteria
MEPKIITLPALKVAGYKINTSNINGTNLKEIPAFWTAYMEDGRMEKLHGADFVKNHAEYGVCFSTNSGKGGFSYVIGVEVKEDVEIPNDFYACELPDATYAMFSTVPSDRTEFSSNIQKTWHYIMNDWFPFSGYEYAKGKVDFELYGEQSRGDSGLVCDIYIPIAKIK